MEHTQEMAQQIRTRIGELEADLAAHRRALAALEQPRSRTRPSSNGAGGGRNRVSRGNAAPIAADASRPVKSNRSSAPRRQRPGVSTEAVFDALKGNDQAAVIAKEFGVSTAVVRNRLEQLEQAGRVSRSGQRRGTRWRSHGSR